MNKTNVILRSAVLLSAPFLFAGLCLAHHGGDVLSAPATVTPVIDGVLSPGEWDDADYVNFTLSYCAETHECTMYVKNDAIHLYIAVIVRDEESSVPGEPGYDFLNVRFDNDHDGVTEQGDNGWNVRGDGAIVRDGYNPNGVPHHSARDVNDGGTVDLVAAVTHTNPVPGGVGDYTVEYRGLLDSDDDLHDFSLAAGDVVGVFFKMADGDTPDGCAVVGNVWPSNFAGDFADIEIAYGGRWTDPLGDVSSSHADMISGSATVYDGMVDLRVQFVDRPYPTTHTQAIVWCIDLDQNPSTGNECGFLSGADIGILLSGGLGALDSCDVAVDEGIDVVDHFWFDPETNTIRLFFPLELLGDDDGVFDYYVTSNFGGSGGANEYAPADGFFTSSLGPLLPFDGEQCPDADDDGIHDYADNCLDAFNPEQLDLDWDGIGDVCDDDDDNDGVFDWLDNCPLVSNQFQEDDDFDGLGNACDTVFDPGSAAQHVEDVVSDVVAILTGINVPGGNGMINKLNGNGGLTQKLSSAISDLEAGEIDAAAYLWALEVALDKLGAFDNQLDAKIGNGQIIDPEASALFAASGEIRATMENLIAAAGG